MSDVSDFTEDSGLPDPDTNGARRLLRDPPVSKETIYRLGKRGEIESYLVAGCRVWRRRRSSPTSSDRRRWVAVPRR